jgi:hypothetical protein
MVNTDNKAQGWYGDPFLQHDARWFSDGTPTALVRDEGIDSTDPPPSTWSATHLAPALEAEGQLLPARRGTERTGGGPPINGIWKIFVSTGGD